MVKPTSADLQIPHANIESWQEIVDIMAEMIGIPAGLIMMLNEPESICPQCAKAYYPDFSLYDE